MPLHAAAAPVIAWPDQAFPPLAGRAPTPASIVLDVLLPPPLALR
jgi:hypothetical protein